MSAIPLIPDSLEWLVVAWVLAAALFCFIASSTGARRPAVNPTQAGGRPGQESPAPVGDGTTPGAESAIREDAAVAIEPTSSAPDRIQRRQSRARLQRISRQSKQENDAALRLYVERRRRLLVMATSKEATNGITPLDG